MKQLAKVKQTIINLSGKVEVKQNLEESFRAERRLLSEEKKKALELLRGIQADIEAVSAYIMNCRSPLPPQLTPLPIYFYLLFSKRQGESNGRTSSNTKGKFGGTFTISER